MILTPRAWAIFACVSPNRKSLSARLSLVATSSGLCRCRSRNCVPPQFKLRFALVGNGERFAREQVRSKGAYSPPMEPQRAGGGARLTKWLEACGPEMRCEIVANEKPRPAGTGALRDGGRSLARRGVQRTSALARQLGGATTHDARRACRRIENRGWTAAGARRGSRRHRNVAPGLAVRRLRIAGHHAIGRSESEGSLKSLSGSNDVRGRGLC